MSKAGLAVSCALLIVATDCAASNGATGKPAPSAAANSTIYVATDGNDSASGTAANPVRTIGRGLALAQPRDKVLVRSGNYHETIKIWGLNGITLAAAPGATVTMDGSSAVTGWAKDGSDWVHTGWTTKFDSSPTLTAGARDGSATGWRFINPSYPMASHPDQVWIDGQALAQVGTRAEVSAGKFYVDYQNDKLYVGTNPSNGQVRASTLSKAVTLQSDDVTLDGINIVRYAPSVPTMGAITVAGNGVSLRNMSVSDNATSGVQVRGNNVVLNHVTMTRNGMIGLRANASKYLRLQSVTVAQNNIEHFNTTPSAGGAKITRSQRVYVNRSTFRDNIGTGLWLDEAVYWFRVINSRFLNNGVHGMSFELCGTGKVGNNVVSGNAGDGMKVNDTDRVAIWNNTVFNNGRAIDIAQDKRDQPGGPSYRDWTLPMTYRVQHITVNNNVLTKVTKSNCVLCVEDHTHRFSGSDLKITANANVYQRVGTAPNWLVIWSSGAGNPKTFTTLSAFKSATGQEARGILLPASSSSTPTSADNGRVAASTKSAVAPPSWVTTAARVPAGTRHLGSWLSY